MRISGKLCAFALCVFIVGIAYAETTDADKKTVASKAYVDTKQDIIQTGNVLLDNGSNVYVPGLVAYDSATQTIKGNQIGILDKGTLDSTDTILEDFGARDDLVPTVAAVQVGFNEIWAAMPAKWTALTWDSAETTSTNAYETKFVGDTGATANAWPRADKTKLINTAALAQGLALKQNKLPAQNPNLVPGQQIGNNIPSSVLAPTTAGNVTQVALWDADADDLVDAAAWDIDDYAGDDAVAVRQSIPTVGAVEVGLNTKQNKMTCAGWDSDTHTDEHCWLWSIAE